MLCLAYKSASPVKGVDEGGVCVVLLVDLETQVSAKDVMEV